MELFDFTKMHGIGNDYVYFNCLDRDLPNPSKNAIALSHRHFGIGADGIVLIKRSETCDFRMVMFNADGSESEMCGNAVRCVGKYVYEKGLTTKKEISLETKGGVKILYLTTVKNPDGKESVSLVKVNMGKPERLGLKIPTTFNTPEVIRQPIQALDKTFLCTCVATGNPHCVIFVDDITDEMVLKYGPVLEVHPSFPNRINVEFAKVISRNELQMRVWERGTGETWACGTGACGVLVAGILEDRLDRKVLMHLLGGNLDLELDSEDTLWKTGPAEFSFEGTTKIIS